MKACIAPTALSIAPFEEPASALPVLTEPLAQIQRLVLEACGLQLLDADAAPPKDEPWLWVGSRSWFTPRLLERFLAAAGADPRLPDGGLPSDFQGARLRIEHTLFQSLTEALQRLPQPGVHELALVPAQGAPPPAVLPLLRLELELRSLDTPFLHPALPSGRLDKMVEGDEMILQIDHWCHLQQVNVLAMAAFGSQQHRQFLQSAWPSRLWQGLRLLLKARSANPFRVAAALSHLGPDCVIHPTAIVEASVLGQGVTVGPFAVVRGSLLGDGVRVDEHASINGSVLCQGAQVCAGATVNLCVLMEGALVSRCGGLQASVFGRHSFLAQHAIVMDRSFSEEIKVLQDGRRQSCGRHFLGVALGHEARIGAGVVLGFGTQVPNGTSVVLDARRVLRQWPEDGGALVKL